jgi:peptide/nickel transport system ATP-binding protein
MRALSSTRSATPAAAEPAREPVAVDVSDLTVVYRGDEGELAAVSRVSIDLVPGEITGLVGESGSGKSTLALALLNAVPEPGRVAGGSIEVTGLGDVTKLRGKRLRHARGGLLGYVFQASQNSLNPLKPVGKQLLDLGRSHGVRDLRALVAQARDLADEMGLDGRRALASYQHELSGGMRQRIGIIFALVLNARVLILDEPTTALDMLSQAAVLEIVKRVHAERGLTTLIVTHDMGVIAEVADRLAVMYGGRIVEDGPATRILRDPQHPYTRGLIGAMPRIVGDPDAAQSLPGRPPDLATLPREGCVFRSRCPLAMPVCDDVDPPLLEVGPRRRVACHAVAHDDAASLVETGQRR